MDDWSRQASVIAGEPLVWSVVQATPVHRLEHIRRGHNRRACRPDVFGRNEGFLPFQAVPAVIEPARKADG